MGEDSIQIAFVSNQLIDLNKGDKLVVLGEEYTMRTKAAREMLSDSHYSYNATFYGVMYELMKTLYRNTDANGVSTKSTFDLTYTIKEFVNVLIYNVSRDYPGLWAFDSANCPDTDPLTIQFSGQNCLQALQTLCSKDYFNLEFQITQSNGVRTIHIGRFGEVVNPPSGSTHFEWGKGNGLYTLKEDKVDDKAIITRLWVEGGSNNIKSGYRDYSDKLQLPFPQRLNAQEHKLADGTIIPIGSQTIGIDDDSKRYFEDAALRDTIGSEEDSEEFSEIYPSRSGEVTALVEGDIYSFIDEDMDFDLNEKNNEGETKWLIAGTSAKINFLTGKLAGQQFELKAEGGYSHSEKKFTLIPYTDERGLKIPTSDNEAFRIEVGNKYKITDINLPDSYVQEAEEKLWYAGLDSFNTRKQARVQYQLTLDRLYFLQNTPNSADTTIFKVGDFVPIKDARFGIEKNIRIQSISRNLLVEHDYSLTLSDTNSISILSQTVVDVMRHNQIIATNRLKDLNKAKRGWRTTEELRNMVYDTDGYFDPENIRPNSIDTNMLTVGSKSQQFVLSGVVMAANVGGNGNQFNVSSGVLSHLTIEESGIKSWTMSSSNFTLTNNAGYYLYAKCSKTGNTGVWHISNEQLKFEIVSDPNNYYFQVGILSSLYEGGFRDFVSTYGFTRINGNTITTGKIVTSDGQCYLDLDGNRFRIGDSGSSIDWGVTAQGQLTLKNVRLISQSGDLANIGVYRGTYNPSILYYKDDEVSYTSNGATCTYRYKHNTPSSNLPTNSVYWDIVAKGADGTDGADGADGKDGKDGINGTDGVGIFSQIRYFQVSSSPTVAPTSWLTSVPQLTETNKYLWSYEVTTYTDNTTSQTPAGVVGVYGDKGIQGNPGTNGINGTNGKDGEDGKDGVNGTNGVDGADGKDGLTSYFHFKYSDDGGLSFTANDGTEPGAYLGCYTDFVEVASLDPQRYVWTATTGKPGVGGTDASALDYYEYRYAKNGSTSEYPGKGTTFHPTDIVPTGYGLTIPDVIDEEYVWQTMAKKSGLTQKTEVHLPINAGESGTIADTSSHNRNGVLGAGASVATIDSRIALNLDRNAECTIPYDLPFGDNFTLCLWMRIDQSSVRWLLNGYNGREYVQNSFAVSPNSWFHLALRFSDRSVTIIKDGALVQTGSINSIVIGFSLFDDSLGGANVSFDDVRILQGALPLSDIERIKSGTADALLQNWSTPIRVNPYNGKNGTSFSKIVEKYAKSSSNSTPPTSWSTTIPTIDASNRYLWNYEEIYSINASGSESKVSDTTPKVIGVYGAKGDAGVSISNVVNMYAVSGSNTTAPTSGWSDSVPTISATNKYLWSYEVIHYSNGSTTETTKRVIGVYGDKGDKGDIGYTGPALVFRGDYDSTASYYGNPQRVDCVFDTYDRKYYVTRVDAEDEYGGLIDADAPPSELEYWNEFGTQFESVATRLLLAENANIAGWLFKNQRLESQDGKVWLDGNNGEMRLKGTLQMSTGVSGNFSDVNLFTLPARTNLATTISMGYERKDVGKRCILFNNSARGSGGIYKIQANRFGWRGNTTYSEADGYYLIAPQESLEMTCYELPAGTIIHSTSIETGGFWQVTNRFHNDLPPIVAMGVVSNNDNGASITGKSIGGDNFTVQRTAVSGTYTITMPALFENIAYALIQLTGIGNVQGGTCPVKATLMSHNRRTFTVRTSDDDTDNAGSFNFVVYSFSGWYI